MYNDKKRENGKVIMGIKYGEYFLEKEKNLLRNNVDSFINIR